MLDSIRQTLKRLFPMILYMVIYLLWFGYLEKTVTTDFHLIHMKLDDYIPFIEYFIIPYDLWFFYVAATLVFLAYADPLEYKHTAIFICLGMTLFLLISTIYPNGHDLRPAVMPRDNLFSQMVLKLQAADTPTNLFPSIHVFNSIGMCIGLLKTKALKNHPWIRVASTTLCVLIVLSTVFLKQHSVFDVYTAFLCVILFYIPVYHPIKKTRHN